MKGSETLGQAMKIILAVFVGVVTLLIVVQTWASLGPSGSEGPATEFDFLISQAAFRYGTEAILIKAIIKQESDFDPSEKSKAGAQGLMQLMPNTVEDLNGGKSGASLYCKSKGMPEITEPFDPEQNINGGTCYLSYLLDRYDNNKELALAAYNAGPTGVDACSCVPNIPETQQYVRLVTDYYNEYKGQSGLTAVG